MSDGRGRISYARHRCRHLPGSDHRRDLSLPLIDSGERTTAERNKLKTIIECELGYAARDDAVAKQQTDHMTHDLKAKPIFTEASHICHPSVTNDLYTPSNTSLGGKK